MDHPHPDDLDAILSAVQGSLRAWTAKDLAEATGLSEADAKTAAEHLSRVTLQIEKRGEVYQDRGGGGYSPPL